MRPHVVEGAAEFVEASLLSGPVPSGWDGGLGLEGSVHALVAGVLLG